MTRTITAPYEITQWDEVAYDTPGEGPALARVTVVKAFTGPLQGTSVAELLTAQGPGGNGYVASERLAVALDGREGTFVLQHGGSDDPTGESRTFGSVVPGSGTGGLAGLRGTVRFAHDADGARMTLAYEL